MDKTPFAGLTVLDPSESVYEDNASFLRRDPLIIDHLLQIGAVTHRHDAHAALGDPLGPPTGDVETSVGTLPADLDVYIGFTLVDDQGGETALSPLLVLSTPPPLDPPTSPLALSVAYDAGSLPVDSFYYAITLVDAMGGETPIGPASSIDRDPLGANARITVAGLTDDFGAVGATAWRLYRARAGEPLGYLASGTAVSYVDDGSACSDAGLEPPADNRTNASNMLTVAVPSGASGVAGATAFNLYASIDGDFSGPCLLGTYPPASAGATLTFPALEIGDASPPDVSTCVRGAAQLNAETDLTALYWRAPVAGSGALGADLFGTVRVALDTSVPYFATASAGAGGAGWRALIGTGVTVTAPNGSGAAISVLDLVASGGASVGFQSLGGGSGRITVAASAGVGGHTIQDEGTPLAARAALDFAGAGVTATDDAGNGRTIVTIPGGAGPTVLSSEDFSTDPVSAGRMVATAGGISVAGGVANGTAGGANEIKVQTSQWLKRDMRVIAKFTPTGSDPTTFLACRRQVAGGNDVRAKTVGGVLRIEDAVGNVLASVAQSISAGVPYWLVGEFVRDSAVAELWLVDPRTAAATDAPAHTIMVRIATLTNLMDYGTAALGMTGTNIAVDDFAVYAL